MFRTILEGNKICADRARERSLHSHRERLKTIEPSLDTGTPRTLGLSVLKSNGKRDRLREERQAEIERLNRLLWQRMEDVKALPTLSKVLPSPRVGERPDRKSSEAQRLRENKEILGRLQQVTSVYSHEDWGKSARENSNFLCNLCTQPVTLRAPDEVDRPERFRFRSLPPNTHRHTTGGGLDLLGEGEKFGPGGTLPSKRPRRLAPMPKGKVRVFVDERVLNDGRTYAVEMTCDTETGQLLIAAEDLSVIRMERPREFARRDSARATPPLMAARGAIVLTLSRTAHIKLQVLFRGAYDRVADRLRIRAKSGGQMGDRQLYLEMRPDPETSSPYLGRSPQTSPRRRTSPRRTRGGRQVSEEEKKVAACLEVALSLILLEGLEENETAEAAEIAKKSRFLAKVGGLVACSEQDAGGELVEDGYNGTSADDWGGDDLGFLDVIAAPEEEGGKEDKPRAGDVSEVAEKAFGGVFAPPDEDEGGKAEEEENEEEEGEEGEGEEAAGEVSDAWGLGGGGEEESGDKLGGGVFSDNESITLR